MLNTIEEVLDTKIIHFTYVRSDQQTLLDDFKLAGHDVVITFFTPNLSEGQLPFRYNPTIHDVYLKSFYALLDKIDRCITRTGTLYIYGLPQWLPYLSVYLNKKGWQFKYWIALETLHPEPSNLPMVNTHEGILLYVRNKDKFSLRKVRSEHQKCDICGDFTADWGGKKHLRNPLGYAISDVWDDLLTVKDKEHILSKEVWQRLILLTAREHSNILCVPYDGVQDLDQYVFQ